MMFSLKISDRGQSLAWLPQDLFQKSEVTWLSWPSCLCLCLSGIGTSMLSVWSQRMLLGRPDERCVISFDRTFFSFTSGCVVSLFCRIFTMFSFPSSQVIDCCARLLKAVSILEKYGCNLTNPSRPKYWRSVKHNNPVFRTTVDAVKVRVTSHRS